MAVQYYFHVRENLSFSGSSGISSFSDLLRICWIWSPTIFIQNFIYINFGIHLTQFYINFSNHKSLKCLGFSLLPLSFFLYSLFKQTFIIIHLRAFINQKKSLSIQNHVKELRFPLYSKNLRGVFFNIYGWQWYLYVLSRCPGWTW